MAASVLRDLRGWKLSRYGHKTLWYGRVADNIPQLLHVNSVWNLCFKASSQAQLTTAVAYVHIGFTQKGLPLF